MLKTSQVSSKHENKLKNMKISIYEIENNNVKTIIEKINNSNSWL